MEAKGRSRFFGLLKPMLENPSAIVESSDGARQFIKAFKSSSGTTLFMSVSRQFDGVSVSITSHPKRTAQIEKIVGSGRLLYTTALNDPEGSLPKKPAKSDDLASIISRDHRQVNDFQKPLELPPEAPPVNSPAFKRWFGDSKVVDEDGRPLVVYHGTDRPGHDVIKTFGVGPSNAAFFARVNDDAIHRASQQRGVYPAYLSLQNPLILDTQDSAGVVGEVDLENDLFAEAESNGHDGVIFNADDADLTTYAVFNPTSIKSVNNRGTFSEDDPNILYQGSERYSVPRPSSAPQRVKVSAISESYMAKFEGIESLEDLRKEIRHHLKGSAENHSKPVINIHTGWQIDVP